MKVFILAIFVSCALTTNATSGITSTTLVTVTESTTLPAPVTYPSDDYRPIEEIKTCGTKYGDPAAKRQFPHVAFLKSKNAYKVQYCSGSLIHPKWVLTSAYCTLPHSIVEVTLGALVPLDEEDPDRVVVQSDDIYIHPGYLPSFQNPKNDVALIKLPRPVKSAVIMPIIMKKGPGPMLKGNVTFAAWGEVGYESLTFTNRILISDGPCNCRDSEKTVAYVDPSVESELFCCISAEHLCFLHNGGGLVVDGVLVAVMSTRCFPHCRHREGIFTNVYKHWDWIDDTLIGESIPDVTIYQTCSDVTGYTPGVYILQPNDDIEPFEVYCDLRLEGYKWTVIQQRFNGSVDFFWRYVHYTNGFGPLTGNHWLGLEKIHQITKNGGYELLVEMEAHNFTNAYALYSTFHVDSEETGFKLTISNYSGNAGDSMYKPGYIYHELNGMKFSTYDKDQDRSPDNCAMKRQGAWWYYDCSASNLNGPYKDTAEYGLKTMHWHDNFDKFALKTARMLIRRK